MKISVITVVYNAERTISDALQSVAAQRYENIEHIVIDGASTDNTLAIIQEYSAGLAQIVSEPDTGIYDAMNKGISLATGDVIGLLNADDVFENDCVLTQVAKVHLDPLLDACYADLVYVDASDISQVRRFWQSKDHTKGLCFKGWMPAHPTFYVKRRVYEKVGRYNTKLKYQADLEFCARAFEVHTISSRYIPELWVRMRLGGVTNGSLKTMLKGNVESYRALKKIGLRRNALSFFILKFSEKIPQFFRRVE